ncbi:hypothetical protein BGW38_009657, partial [Lunasporangiospora selenospora]
TQVTPITRYQPLVQSFAPIVQAEVDCPLTHGFAGHYPRFYPTGGKNLHYLHGRPMLHPGFLSTSSMVENIAATQGAGFMDHIHGGPLSIVGSVGPVISTDHRSVKHFRRAEEEGEEDLAKPSLFRRPTGGFEPKRYMEPNCIPSVTDSCIRTLEMGKTNMGSTVSAIPKNVIQPATVYQGRVQVKEAEIAAAAASHAALSKSHVQLASETKIQPKTGVFPETVYQPTVEQKKTVVEMAEPQYSSLAQSSASLGSTVTIRPVTTVEPLTVFQPKIASLPFLIKDAGCEFDI